MATSSTVSGKKHIQSRLCFIFDQADASVCVGGCVWVCVKPSSRAEARDGTCLSALPLILHHSQFTHTCGQYGAVTDGCLCREVAHVERLYGQRLAPGCLCLRSADAAVF